uniref:Uncharacterized protein n=1 Tax=Eucampia antarctica TaxID=49252 RepID=A0A7S2WJB7_9STRA|mmetsp:Transcript_3891/g.3655  ORF Transcript_3891/g.3655 Transcript_3891/m.3655 type:complete len:107 (+) Transcript_3891:105-425(+)
MDAMCYTFNITGHTSYKCPELTEQERNERRARLGQRRSETRILHYGYSLTQMSDEECKAIDPNWLLLDNCSTDNVINNAFFVKDIRKVKRFVIQEILRSPRCLSYY